MAVETVNVSLAVPKESKEVVDALAGIVEHFKAGKPIAEAAALLPQVMVAVDGYDKIAAEVGSEYNDELAGYLVKRVLSALKTPGIVNPILPAAA